MLSFDVYRNLIVDMIYLENTILTVFDLVVDKTMKVIEKHVWLKP